jgi:poly-gamma-glutamate capsule biosynthesis protein CapA/YwtB (metallophosphatase superfamily)
MIASAERSLTVLLAGDALIVGTYAIEERARRSFVELVRASDIAFTNLEVLLNEFRGPPAPGIGIHLSATRRSGRELLAVGFNLVSVANNHALDYGVEGLRRHLDALRALGMPYAGAGESATEAAQPLTSKPRTVVSPWSPARRHLAPAGQPQTLAGSGG